MITIYKYPIVPTFEQSISIHAGYRILALQVQDGVPCIWAIVNTDAQIVNLYLHTIGTGHPADEFEDKQHVGTYQLSQGEGHPIFVGHVFIKHQAASDVKELWFKEETE